MRKLHCAFALVAAVVATSPSYAADSAEDTPVEILKKNFVKPLAPFIKRYIRPLPVEKWCERLSSGDAAVVWEAESRVRILSFGYAATELSCKMMPQGSGAEAMLERTKACDFARTELDKFAKADCGNTQAEKKATQILHDYAGQARGNPGQDEQKNDPFNIWDMPEDSTPPQKPEPPKPDDNWAPVVPQKGRDISAKLYEPVSIQYQAKQLG